MSWPWHCHILQRWLCFLPYILESFIFGHRVSVKWILHHFLRIGVVVAWPWVLIFLYERVALYVFSANWERVTFPLFICFLGVMIKIIQQGRIIFVRWRSIWYDIKNWPFLSDSKLRCLEIICWWYVIVMILRILFFYSCLYAAFRVEPLSFWEWKLEFRRWSV